jgi:acyl-coenzyme A thioesterase PaaI-like protein
MSDSASISMTNGHVNGTHGPTPTEHHEVLGTPVPPPRLPVQTPPGSGVKRNWFDKVEAFISRLSSRDNFWHAVCSFIWLPLAFFSGIKMKKLDANTFAAYLPFKRFNRNWYSAMAGGALLANSEIAGGMYVFGVCGSDYTVVCKELNYKFLRPCLGPAVYRMQSRENIHEQMRTGGEFNIVVDLTILQQGFRPGEKDKRVGLCVATFHVTPKVHHKKKKQRAEIKG